VAAVLVWVGWGRFARQGRVSGGVGRPGGAAGHPFAAAGRHDGVRGVAVGRGQSEGATTPGGGHDLRDPRRPGAAAGHAARGGLSSARTRWSRRA